jgi:asparagine synthase (glutamine-hydrolysing)
MSVQFGRWNRDGMPVGADYIGKVHAMISPYAADGEGSYLSESIAILYRAFHTTKESRRDNQPCVSAIGVLVWDGRLDNRAEIIAMLRDVLPTDPADVSIVSAAYQRWGTSCFSKLVGDWALSVWDPDSRALVLAKDPIGARNLYYSFDRAQVTWSTVLEPLVLLAGGALRLSEEYIAGCLSFFPATHITPYQGIYCVPPSCFVQLGSESCITRKYWDFDPGKRNIYGTDSEYEEHFRAVFGEAVRRRLRSDSPVLAELSGGMDSSSIVCMADEIAAQGRAETPRLDTVSYYDDTEPNWNERPYFTRVEQQRGRTGCHIDVRSKSSSGLGSDRVQVLPGSGRHSPEALVACLSSKGNRVVLSGIGGDEVTGGVPTPTPELEDLLAKCQFRMLAHQLKVWALNKRKPWLHLFFESARGFLPPALVGAPKNKRPASWLNPAFIKRNRVALRGYEARLRLFGPLPTFQENMHTLELLRRQLASEVVQLDPPREKRYPYLDRDLLEFLFAIPRDQLVRPGQRRSLMRRALAGIVPAEILNRKRKAFVARAPLNAISQDWAGVAESTQNMVSSSLGIVDGEKFSEILQKARHGQEVPTVIVMRTLGIESWLRNLCYSGILALNVTDSPTSLRDLVTTTISAEKN